MAKLPERRPSDDVDVVHTPSTTESPNESTSTDGGFEQVDRVDLTPSGIERRERAVRDRIGSEHRESITRDVGAEYRQRIFKAEQTVWLILGIIDALIGVRVVLKLIGANPANAFAQVIYSAAALFLGPFFGLTSTPSWGRMVLEVPSIIAMIVYALVAWGITQLLRLILLRGTTRTYSTYDRYRS